MGAPKTLSSFKEVAREKRAFVAAAAIGVVVLTALWSQVYASKGYDRFDIGNYFLYASWVDGAGKLYVDVYSDYLLLANLLFAPFRLVATHVDLYHDPLKTFGWIWLTTAWVLFVWATWIISTRAQPRSLLLWLAPAPLYFSLFRYEIYIVLLTFAFLFALERRQLVASSLWLGLVIALKGYGLFLLPCYLVYLSHQLGLRRALALCALAVVPFVAEHLAVFCYAGTDGVLMPYRFQGNRPNTPESLYNSAFYVLMMEPRHISPRIAQALQAIAALAAAGMRPKTFQDWLRASAFAVIGFVLFSPASSPQFFLWVLPMIVLLENERIRRMFGWLSWLSFLDYPLVQFLFGSTRLKAKTVTFLYQQTTVAAFVLKYVFPPVAVALSVVRIFLFSMLALDAWGPRTRRRTDKG